MRLLLSGSTGLLGSHLLRSLRNQGHVVVPLVRSGQRTGTIVWQVDKPLAPEAVSGFDAVIHLAGEPVAGLWSAAKKQRILDSRALGTRNLAEALAHAPVPPRVFLCASGINVYGDCGDAVVDEQTPPGRGFLPQVCEAWEAACDPMRPLARVVNMRIGVVLAPDGGMLCALLPMFRLGLGSVVGRGEPYVSWISLGDLLAAVGFLLDCPLQGPVNLVAPEPVTASDFARQLAAALHRPLWLRVPLVLVRTLLGEFAQETILSSVRAQPRALLEAGFAFAQPDLRAALMDLLA